MSVPRFFDRVSVAVGRHLSIGRDTLDRKLDGTLVRVHVGDIVLDPPSNELWIAELLANMLCRLYPSIEFVGGMTVTAHLASLVRRIQPGIAVAIVASAQTDGVVEVVIGASSGAPPGALRGGASGWVAAVTTGEETGIAGPLNPFSSGAVASLLAAAVFRRVFRQDTVEEAPPRAVKVSLLDFSAESGEHLTLPQTHFSRVLLAGLGAVGNAAIWALARHKGLRGEITLADGEAIELSNLQRYVLTGDQEVGRAKIELAAEAFAHLQLKIHTRKERLGEGPGDWEVILVGADNPQARRVAQALLPRLTVNGWTSDTGLGASWHDFSEENACLACLYQPTGLAPSQTELAASSLGLTKERAAELWVLGRPLEEKDVAKVAQHFKKSLPELAEWTGKNIQALYTGVVCGSAGLDVTKTGHLEAVPLAHQSVLAGILCAAELVKRTTPDLCTVAQKQSLVAWHDVLRDPPRDWLQKRLRAEGCICSDRIYRDVYAKKWPVH